MSKVLFVDHAKIFIKAGSGGDGHVSFRREKFIPFGGPDGGDGGRGGHIIVRSSANKTTLRDFQFHRHFRAKDGRPGGRKQMTGASGDDLVIEVPLGTVFRVVDEEKVVGEITKFPQEFVLARGGNGGRGNMNFATSTNRAPRTSTPGEKTEGIWMTLELKLLADIGIIGEPNVGKSSLLGTLTRARPKVADYPFTTLSPSLGVLKVGDKSVTLADIPGLIEGAHQGAGLGTAFLRHVERTRALLFVISAEAGDPKNAWASYQVTKHELEMHDPAILKKKQLFVLNKTDLVTEDAVAEIVAYFKKRKKTLIPVSAKDGTGLTKLTTSIKGLF